MYQVKLLNKISPSGLERLPSSLYQYAEDVENPDAILVRSASMHELELPESVRAIARCGAGTNNIPIDKCSEAGIAVFNTPGANANAVKELTIAGLLLSARKIFPAMEWAQGLKGQGAAVPGLVEKGKSQFSGPELKGKKLGVIGLGAIGVMVCNAARHFGMEIYGYDPYLSVDSAWNLSRSIIRANSYKEIYENCDFITLHVPVTNETKGMINSQSIHQMKHGVRLINFSRGDLVDNDDLLVALGEKQVYCYITDFPCEELLGQPGVIALPHLGASTPESEDNCAAMAADEIRDFLENGNIRNSVNLPAVVVERTGRQRVTVIHRNSPGMISKISGAMGANIDNLTNKSRGDYAYTVLDLDNGVTDEILQTLRSTEGIIRVTVIK
ncbi:phosphoglycerate dehydrogenase [Ruminococcaceae bacterium OttesenSCG-928-L11]|nr:phosphoglycerate dehydrogenase [Ruminococcaceae bacterium OttesenSCG-928-L11]